MWGGAEWGAGSSAGVPHEGDEDDCTAQEKEAALYQRAARLWGDRNVQGTIGIKLRIFKNSFYVLIWIRVSVVIDYANMVSA